MSTSAGDGFDVVVGGAGTLRVSAAELARSGVAPGAHLPRTGPGGARELARRLARGSAAGWSARSPPRTFTARPERPDRVDTATPVPTAAAGPAPPQRRAPQHGSSPGPRHGLARAVPSCPGRPRMAGGRTTTARPATGHSG